MAALSFALVLAAPMRYELLPYDPVAAPKAMVNSGPNARFTVLTPRVIRMEYATAADSDDDGDAPGPVEGAQFEDRASLVFINRRLPTVPKFDVANETGTWCNITVYDESGAVSVQLAFNKAAAAAATGAQLN